MRLFELMNIITPTAVKVSEQHLNEDTYMQRIVRTGTMHRTPQDFEQLIQQVKSDPAFKA